MFVELLNFAALKHVTFHPSLNQLTPSARDAISLAPHNAALMTQKARPHLRPADHVTADRGNRQMMEKSISEPVIKSSHSMKRSVTKAPAATRRCGHVSSQWTILIYSLRLCSCRATRCSAPRKGRRVRVVKLPHADLAAMEFDDLFDKKSFSDKEIIGMAHLQLNKKSSAIYEQELS